MPGAMVLPLRIELRTSPLPRECSTTELRQPGWTLARLSGLAQSAAGVIGAEPSGKAETLVAGPNGPQAHGSHLEKAVVGVQKPHGALQAQEMQQVQLHRERQRRLGRVVRAQPASNRAMSLGVCMGGKLAPCAAVPIVRNLKLTRCPANIAR